MTSTQLIMAGLSTGAIVLLLTGAFHWAYLTTFATIVGLVLAPRYRGRP